MDDVHPAQPGGGDETSQIGRRPSPEAHDEIVAGESCLGQPLPTGEQALRCLGQLCVRDDDLDGIGEQRIQLSGLLRQACWMDERHPTVCGDI